MLNKISTSYQTVLRLNSYIYDNQIYMWGLEVIPSKADYNSTNGIFGNSNGNSNDDLKFIRNTNTTAVNMEEFFESFK